MLRRFTPRNDKIVDLGITDYEVVHQQQLQLASDIALKKSDELILITEHFPVYTCGRRTRPEDRPVGNDIPVVDIERGGELTYHGPGQIVGYPILDLNRRKMSIPQYLRKLEEMLIAILKTYGIEGRYRQEYCAGVWSGDKKLVSIGIAVRRWVTFHGFALNVDCDLTPFRQARPCGMSGNQMTSLKELGCNISKEELKKKIETKLAQTFFDVIASKAKQSPIVSEGDPSATPQDDLRSDCHGPCGASQ
ncbi:MAG: lipoyl(octanoyl) transferase [Deltaproteobacteria bacterium RIFCSPLOWO2_02_FULL_46_8]|nr:MAG: lipoyl(octanoyl) transferase [Deltaproteobacteria bacterium RIFCSPLOWO2_02_FULL_46_8]